MSLLKGLIGQTVNQVSDDIATYLPIDTPTPFPEGGQAVLIREITFEHYTLTIANPVRLTQAGVEQGQLTALIGKTVSSVEENDQRARIDLSTGLRLEIDLREESFIGPEAMVLHGPNDLIVVWN